MTKFSETSAEVDEAEAQLKAEPAGGPPERKIWIDGIADKLGRLQDTVAHFKKVAQETDPQKRLYGPSMAKKCLDLDAKYSLLLRQALEVQAEVGRQVADQEAARAAAEAEEAERKAKEEAARKAREEEEACRAQEAEAARKAKEEEARKAEEAARRAREEEAARKAREERELAWRAKEEEEARRAKEEEEARAGQVAQREAAARAAREQEEKERTEGERRTAEVKRAEEEKAAKEAAAAKEEQEKWRSMPTPAAAATPSSSATSSLAAAPSVAPATPAPVPPPEHHGVVYEVTGGAEELLQFLSRLPEPLVVVDWYADWCGPCRAMSPILKQFAAKYPDVIFLKINTDKPAANHSLAQEAAVRALPTFHIYRGSARVAELTGANPNKLEQLVAAHREAPVTTAGSAGPSAGGAASGRDLVADVMAAFTKLRQGSPYPQFVESTRTLLAYVTNALAHPADQKYRRIKSSNAVFQSRVAALPGGLECMRAFGFRETRSPENEAVLVLEELHPQLPRVKALLEQAVSAAGGAPGPSGAAGAARPSPATTPGTVPGGATPVAPPSPFQMPDLRSLMSPDVMRQLMNDPRTMQAVQQIMRQGMPGAPPQPHQVQQQQQQQQQQRQPPQMRQQQPQLQAPNQPQAPQDAEMTEDEMLQEAIRRSLEPGS